MAERNLQGSTPYLRELTLTAAVAASAVLLLLVAVAIDPATCFRDDMLAQYLGASRAVWLATKAGHLALVTPHSWFGGALAGEYQHGVFSVFAVATHALAWSVGGPLRLTAFLLVAAPLAWLVAGAFWLARGEGCSVSASLLAASLATFNSWTLVWAIPWYPSLATFAWIPWLLWALRRGGASRPFYVAVAIYAIVAGGWPFTVGMAAVACAFAMLLEARRARDWRPLASTAAGGLIGLALAAPALAMLLQFGNASERLAAHGMSSQWRVPLRALPSLLVPFWRTTWETFGSDEVRAAPELFALVPVCLIVAAALTRRFRRGFLAQVAPWLALALVALALSLLPSWLPSRWSFRWLPLFHLALAVGAARSLDLVHRASRRSSDVPSTLRSVLRAAPAAVALSAAFLVFGAQPRTPTWPLTDDLAAPQPFDARRLYLGLYGFASIVEVEKGGALRFGNQPLLADLSFVNGYSPMHPEVVMDHFPLETHGCFHSGDARFTTAAQDAVAGTLLDELGIDGLVVTPELGPEALTILRARGWVPVASVGAGFVLHKGGSPAPRAWLVDASAKPDGVAPRLAHPAVRLDESDDEAAAYLDAPLDRPALLVFKRAGYPGYQATVQGKPSPSGLYLGTLVAVPLPAGTTGPVRVWYWPRALTWGFAIASSALVILIAWGAVAATKQRRLRH